MKRLWLGKYRGITIYPFIFIYVEGLPATEKFRLVHHEQIHIRQAAEEYVVWFYIKYLWYYVANLFKGMNFDKAYRNIPYEREAYDNQRRIGYLANRPRFAYRQYRKP
jgi:hypothetical protein